jgi:hypothetical protein
MIYPYSRTPGGRKGVDTEQERGLLTWETVGTKYYRGIYHGQKQEASRLPFAFSDRVG